MHTYHVVIERDEAGLLVGSVPELPGCHTQAKTQEKLLLRIREAIQLYHDVHGRRAPTHEFVGVQVVEVPA